MTVTTEPVTNTELLSRVCDPHDRDAWDEFVSVYRPLLFRIGRRYGLQEADALNLVQEVLRKVVCQLERWQSDKPSTGFRRWLARVAQNAAIDAIRRVKPDAARGGTSVLKQLHQVSDDRVACSDELRRELERQAFRWAATRIRDEFAEETWSTFWQTMVEGQSCEEVAETMNKSLGAVYTARSRVMRRLKRQVTQFDWQAAEDSQLDGDAAAGSAEGKS